MALRSTRVVTQGDRSLYARIDEIIEDRLSKSGSCKKVYDLWNTPTPCWCCNSVESLFVCPWGVFGWVT